MLEKLSYIFAGEIILQTDQYCSICTTNEEFCRNPAYAKTKYRFLSRDEDDISSNAGPTYQDGRNCIVSIQARPNHQIEVQITTLAVDIHAELDGQGYPIKCYDYLKLFNGRHHSVNHLQSTNFDRIIYVHYH